jgi:O-antigen ligase
MRVVLIEGGIYLLLLFAPLAFGGVELWAVGVIQILSGLVFVAWVSGLGSLSNLRKDRTENGPEGSRPAGLYLWIPIGLFVLLVGFQLTPLPASWIRILSPATHDLYQRTLPGYAEVRGFTSQELATWLVGHQGDRIPAALDPNRTLELLASSEPAREIGEVPPARRTLSIYPHGTRESLTLFLCFAGLFAAVVGHFRTMERLQRLLGVAVFSAFTVSLIGIVQKLTWNEKLYWVREGDYANLFGPFVNRNYYAAFADMVLPVALCMALGALREFRSGRTESLPRLLLSGFAAVVIAGGIFYSLSRGGMIATGLSILIVAALMVYLGRHRMELILLGVLLVVAAGFLVWIGPEQVVERVETFSEGTGAPTLAWRILGWERALSLIADHPLLGTGLGTFRYGFMRYAPPGKGWWLNVNNEYIELLCDTGLLGGLLFLLGMAAFGLRVARPHIFRGRSGRYAYTGLVAGMTAILLHSLVSSNIHIPSNGLMLVVLGGALLGLVSYQETSGLRRRSGESGRRRERSGAS